MGYAIRYFLVTKGVAALKLVSFCLRRLKIPKIWRRTFVVAISKPMKLVETQKVIDQYLYSVSPTRFSRGLSMSSQLLFYCSPKSSLSFDVGSQPWIKSFCRHRASRILSRLRKRPVPYLSISQRHRTLSGTVALPVRY